MRQNDEISVCWANSMDEPLITLPEDCLESLRPNLPNSIQTCLHAEVRIVLYFFQTSSSNLVLSHPGAIGCNNWRVPLWIDEYNKRFNARWRESRTCGKPETFLISWNQQLHIPRAITSPGSQIGQIMAWSSTRGLLGCLKVYMVTCGYERICTIKSNNIAFVELLLVSH